MATLAFLFSFRGTASGGAALSVALVSLILQVMLAVLGQAAPMQQRYIFPVLALSMVAMLAVSARRLHHAGYTGRWAMLTVIPLAGLIPALVIALLPQQRTRIVANNGARVAGYIGMALLLALGLWRVWWTPFWIPSESMKPTILVGDYVIVRAQAAPQLQRGDVVVLRHPATGAALIKRVIAVAGDEVAMAGGTVILNGTPLPQLPRGRFDEVMAPQGPEGLRPRCENGLVGDGARCSKSILREVLPDGRSYDTLNISDNAPTDTLANRRVPAGHVFVLGDNRDNSLDSRQDTGVGGTGTVPIHLIYGQATRVLFSASGSSMLAFWTWRADRFFAKVN